MTSRPSGRTGGLVWRASMTLTATGWEWPLRERRSGAGWNWGLAVTSGPPPELQPVMKIRERRDVPHRPAIFPVELRMIVPFTNRATWSAELTTPVEHIGF